MRYRLSMPEPHSHLFHVELVADRPGDALELVFPVWTPGSYLVREFARHVEGAAAEDGEGRALPLERLDKHRLLVRAGGAARVVVRYRVYANELTVRTAHLDGTHGFLNPAAVVPYARGREGEEHVLEIAPPPGWHVSTALDGGPTEFTARDYDELADSPVEIGTHRVLRFTALGKPHELAVWGRGNLDERAFPEDARRVVEALGALMGGLPYARYLFVVHLADRRRGGLEHAASTTLQLARTGFFPRKAYEESLGLLAHEFFHVWNVKRLRPAAFIPFDYAREQYTRLLWWFEGATSYYEQVALARAGLLEPKRWLEALGRALTSLERTPGARKTSVEESSFLAWVKLYRPDENTPNSTVSYYLKGELVALALDLALRRAGRSLDELLRVLYDRHARDGVPEDGVEQVAATLLGADDSASLLRSVRAGDRAAGARPRRRRPPAPAPRRPGLRRQGRDRGEGRRRPPAGRVARRGAGARAEAGGRLGDGGEPRPSRRAVRGGRDRGRGRLPRGPGGALGPPVRARAGRRAQADGVPARRARRGRRHARRAARGRRLARAPPGGDPRAARRVRGVVRRALARPRLSPYMEPLMAFDPKLHAARRARVFEEMERRGGGVMILPAADEKPRNADSEYLFRQDSDYAWTIGLDEPMGGALLLARGGERKLVLFVRPRDREKEIWNGRRTGVEGAKDGLRRGRGVPGRGARREARGPPRGRRDGLVADRAGPRVGRADGPRPRGAPRARADGQERACARSWTRVGSCTSSGS